MTIERVLEILESAKDSNGQIPMSLVRQAFDKLSKSQYEPFKFSLDIKMSDEEIERIKDRLKTELNNSELVYSCCEKSANAIPVEWLENIKDGSVGFKHAVLSEVINKWNAENA